jgi:hypothetical protein
VAWRPARSLITLQTQLQAGAPLTRPPGTSADEWGLIGDTEHNPESDHTPHDFPGWGSNIVTAADFPNRPDLGLDAHKVLDDIRRSQDPRAKYGISNDQIFSNHGVTQGGRLYPAWTWRPYLPYDSSRDRHETHGHLSVVGDARADGTQPWQTIGAPDRAGEDDDMGASFGPIQLGLDQTSLTIPPVQAGIADPRQVWLNVGADLGTAPGNTAAVRIWASNGDGAWFPVNANGSADGLHVLKSGVVLSIELSKGLRILSISRKAVDAQGKPAEPSDELRPFLGSISVCFERG